MLISRQIITSLRLKSAFADEYSRKGTKKHLKLAFLMALWRDGDLDFRRGARLTKRRGVGRRK